MSFVRRIAGFLSGRVKRPRIRRGFIENRAGTTAIEFGMIAIPFLGLLGAVFETGFVQFKQAQLQVATEVASRAVLTNNVGSSITYKDFIEKYVCTWKKSGKVEPGTLSRMFDCSKVMIDIATPAQWANANTANDFYSTYDAGKNFVPPPGGTIAIIRVAYPMGVIMNILTGSALSTISVMREGQTQYKGAWTHMLLGVSAFRVEPQ